MGQEQEKQPTVFGRRAFIVAAGGATGVALATGPLGLFDRSAADASTRTTFRLLRATDQMIVDVDLVNLTVTGGNITPTNGSGMLRLTFGSQHTAEAAIDGTAGTPTAPNQAFAHRVAGSSWVVFEVTAPIPFTLGSLLDLSKHTLVLDDRATNQNGGSFFTGVPGPNVTSIELPYDLRISPHQFARFGTDAVPQSIDDVTEVFRLRIGRLNGGVFTEEPLAQPLGRTLHTSGSTDPASPEPTSLYLPNQSDREDLVELMAGTERTFEIEKLWLSPAGGAFSASAAFPAPRPANNNIVGWTQRVVTGRDTFVQIVDAGFVLPWGLPAAIINQTERRFVATTGSSELTAAMVFEQYLVTSPAVINPNAGNGAPDSGRGLPFDDMALGAVEQRPIGTIDFPNATPGDAFWVTNGQTGDPLSVPVTVTDKAGNIHTVSMPIAFVTASVANEEAGSTTTMADVRSDYNSQNGAPAGSDVRDVDFAGRRVGWTAPRTTDEGTLSTERMRLQVEDRTPDPNNDLPAFSPTIERAWIIDDTVGGATGKEQPAAEVQIPSVWRDFGDSSNNPVGTFLEYVTPITIGDFTGEGGGLGSPGFVLEALSLAFGSGPNLGDFSAGPLNWDPLAALNNATLLGFIKLGDIVENVILNPPGILDGFDFPEIPRFSIELPTVPTIPEEVCYRFAWQPESLSSQGIFLAGSDAPEVSGDAGMKLDILTCIAPLEQDAAVTIEAEVTNFGLRVPASGPAIALGFTKVKYSKHPGQEATTDVDFAGLEFIGELGFLEPVKQLFDSVSETFTVLPSPTGVEAEARFPIPPVNFGVLEISNLEGTIGVDISFDGSPVVMRGTLGRQVDPFVVRVLSAGGTGWFEIDVSAETGVERLSAGFAVTYTTGVNVVVAKVSITGSIGGGIEIVNGAVTVLVFIAIEGTASAFGISVGFTAELELSYNSATEVLRGIARVTVGFYTKIVDVEKSFEIEQEIVLGDGSAPASNSAPAALAFADVQLAAAQPANPGGFAQQYSASAWTDYTASFA